VTKVGAGKNGASPRSPKVRLNVHPGAFFERLQRRVGHGVGGGPMIEARLGIPSLHNGGEENLPVFEQDL
jgi:hypothetical protein